MINFSQILVKFVKAKSELGGIDDFKEFKSNLSKQNQLGGSDALGKSLPVSYCMHFWTQGST